MNIVKFKFADRPLDDVFNSIAKGKYAYLIQMRYAVPFDAISPQQYYDFEQDVTKLTNQNHLPITERTPYWDIVNTDALAWVDADATDAANSISKFITANEFVPKRYSWRELKRFKYMLASAMLKLDVFTPDQIKVLSYFAAGEEDDVLKELEAMENHISATSGEVAGCGCMTKKRTITTYSNADAVSRYKAYRDTAMTEILTNLCIWEQYPVDFIKTVRGWVEDIVTIQPTIYVPTATDMSLLDHNTPCSTGFDVTCILRDLVKALDYMVDDDVARHRDFIIKTLTVFADDIYPNMVWY